MNKNNINIIALSLILSLLLVLKLVPLEENKVIFPTQEKELFQRLKILFIKRINTITH